MRCSSILELAHMVMLRNTWGGAGWGVIASLNLHTWLMLHNTWGGVGCHSNVELARMVDARQHMGWDGVVWGVIASLNLHKRSVHSEH